MNVYIASVFADKARVKERAQELVKNGIFCTSRWADETAQPHVKIRDCTNDFLTETAVFDVEDILASDVLVLTVPSILAMTQLSVEQLARGGRHVESGIMYGLMLAAQIYTLETGRPRELIVLGNRENIFHYLDGTQSASKFPTVKQFDTWEEVLEYLKGRNQ